MTSICPVIAVVLLIGMCGCGPPPHSALQSKYARLAAEFDREEAKAKRLYKAVETAADRMAAGHFRSVFGGEPTEDEMKRTREELTTGRYPHWKAYREAYESLPEVIAARQQSERVTQLKEDVEKARQEWIDAEGTMPAAELKRKLQLRSMRQQSKAGGQASGS